MLDIERHFTTTDIDPYDKIDWELRTARVGRADEAPVFEQTDIEVPVSWSQNATNIVAQKYFAYAADDPRRETSIRQMINRVVDKMTTEGIKNGYFDDSVAKVFSDELRHILVNQLASFNSPVWFNLGVAGAPQQASACFILSVDDSLESITRWYTEEAKIFQGGSGAGVNLSALRGSGEQLSRGGVSSGPVTFMRAADASAGTLQSGGRTRRAAKLVCLDVDHPDIEDFIHCKAREEDRIHALAAAGFDMSINTPAGEKNRGEATAYQNANNSVRVSDEFMKAVANDEEWELTARTDGHVMKRLPARELLKEIAEAAWHCADPGLQFSSTIQDWHTTPEFGPITASNPCFVGDTRVHTSLGLLRFDELYRRAQAGEEFLVYTHQATAEAPGDGIKISSPEAIMRNGVKPVVKLCFSDGRELRCTPSHRLWTINRGYVQAKDLKEEDDVMLNDQPTPTIDASWELPVSAAISSQEVRTGKKGQRFKKKELPLKWSEPLAELIGHLIGDGCMTEQQTVWVYGPDDVDDGTMTRHQQMLIELFGGCSHVLMGNGTHQLRLGSKSLRDFLQALGAGKSRAADKKVPDTIFSAPAEIVAAFLRGLYGADGCVARTEKGKASRYIGLGSTSETLLQNAQTLLTGFGIRPRLYKTRSKRTDRGFSYKRVDGTSVDYASQPLFDLRLTGSDTERFSRLIGFSTARKNKRLKELIDANSRYSTKRSIRMMNREAAGTEMVYNLSEPINHSYIVNGIPVANCSEYMHVDNSACNLASLNLLKFLNADGSFDIEGFVHTVRIIFIAQEITIAFADFPTRKIAKNTKALRQIGIGYANLGALLMACGLPYDSDDGRAYAAAITALMTGEAYRTSAMLAEKIGPFEHYQESEASMLRIMDKHRTHARKLKAPDETSRQIVKAAKAVWDDTVAAGTEHGVRNAQASVIAPTGTISFMLDCDTTGIEPDFALVKQKALVGGGSMTLINRTIPLALKNLGYQPEQIKEIIAYIEEEVDRGNGYKGPRGNVIGAPHLREQHYHVFDCAVGENAIEPMGHVKMVGAVQPFLSGSVSKTVNLPKEATVEDITEVYTQAWELGLKALAVYRDSSKAGQPLGEKEDRDEKAVKAAEARLTSLLGDGLLRGERRPIPREAKVVGVNFNIGTVGGYVHVRLFEDGTPGAIFVDVGQAGSTLHGFIHAWAVTMSLGFQYGLPLDMLVSKLAWAQFEPSGMTDDPQIRTARSIVDYVVRWLATEFLELDPITRQKLGLPAPGSGSGQADDDHASRSPIPGGEILAAPEVSAATRPKAETPAAMPNTPAAGLCSSCGGMLVRTGTCTSCTVCGDTSGCG